MKPRFLNPSARRSKEPGARTALVAWAAAACAALGSGCASKGVAPGKAVAPPSSVGGLSDVELAPVLPSAAGSADSRCPRASASSARSVRELVAAASGCARKGEWAAAERHASELARRDLESPWAPYFMSLAAGAAGDSPRALWMAELALKKQGGSAPLFRYQRGRALLALGRKGEAFSEIQAAADAEARLVEAHVFVGETLLAEQDAPKAEAAFRKALEAEPRHLRALKGLQASRVAQGDASAAPSPAQASAQEHETGGRK